MRKVLLALLAACALAAPAAAAKKAKTETKPMEWKGQFGGPEKPGTKVIETEADWKSFWEAFGKPAPAADFKKSVAVVVYAGVRNSGGYSVKWTEPKDEGKRVVVRYSVAPPDGMAIMALTQPWAVRLIDKPSKPVAVEEK